MLKVSGLRLRPGESESQLAKKAQRELGCEIKGFVVLKRSVDARKKDDIALVYTIAVKVPHEAQVLKKCRSKKVSRYEERAYQFPVERLRLEMEKYCYEQERAIRQMEEELAELREDYERTCVYAPASGYISDVVYLKEGEPVYSGTTLASLYSTDRLLLRVKNENGQFRYNMPVTVETGVAKSRVTVSGRVVATDLLLSSADRTENVAYIQLDDTGEEVALKNSQASCETVRILNVLTAPRATLTLEAGNYYVNKLVDGRVEKRFVNVRLANTQQLWVLQGLDEGDLVIRD